MAEPILFGTEKDYAWDAWRKANDEDGLSPDRAKFNAWWDSVALARTWTGGMRELFEAAWNASVDEHAKFLRSGYAAWWQEILDKQPVVTMTPTDETTKP
jgi:hypothetical protein